jgi:hypothetical protein
MMGAVTVTTALSNVMQDPIALSLIMLQGGWIGRLLKLQTNTFEELPTPQFMPAS